MTFGKILLQYKEKKHLTFLQISKCTGLSQAYLCDITKERRTPSVINAVKIIRGLSIPPKKILEIT